MEQNKILIKKVKVIDPLSSYNGKTVDILIEEDIITSIKSLIEDKDAQIFTAENLCVSPGWFDLRANFCDPGFEEKESIESGANAAIFGGFTGLALSPETQPRIDSKSIVEYVYKKAEDLPVNIYPMGAFSKNLNGEELSEMYDMFQAGAIAFSHGKTCPDNLSILKLALQYQKDFAGPLHIAPVDSGLAKGGQMHEGEVSTYLGLKGIPSLAEEISTQNILHLAEYAETSVHLAGISSKETLALLKTAQANGQEYTADVSLANLCFNDKHLESYDSNYKLMPPLRGEEDRLALIEALNKGLIHAIASDHYPENVENKMCEFDHSAFGMISLETFIGALGKAFDGKVSWDKIIELIALNPRRILGLEIPTIEEGNAAELTFFDPEKEWIFNKKDIQSKSTNTPFIGKQLKGKALGIFNEGLMVWLDN
jgi:dihydroorotase